MCTIMVCVRNFPHLVVVVCVSWGRRFALWRRCRPGSHCKALYSYWGFFSSCWWMVGLYAAPVPVSSGGSNRWQSPLPCLKNRAVELLTHKAQTTTNRPICLNYCPIFATVCVLCPMKCTDDDQRYPHITNGEIRHWISIMNTKVKCNSTVRISHVLRFSFWSHAGYFSFLISQWFSEYDSDMSYPAAPKYRIGKYIHVTRESLSDPSLSFLYFWPGPDEIQHPGQRRPVPESYQTKRFSFWAVKRRNATTFVSQVEPCDYTYSCLTYSPSLADIHAGSGQMFTHLENNRRRNDGDLKFERRCW